MEKKSETKIQKKDKAPAALTEFSQGLQYILKEVESIEKILDGTDIEENENKLKEEEKKKEKSENSGKDNGDSKDEEKNKENNKSETSIKDLSLLDTWINVDKKIEEIHNKWNLYEVEGVEKGIGIETREKLEEGLNSLTKSIEDRNILEIYDYGSQTMLGSSHIFNMYKDETKGNIDKIRYHVYQSYLKSIKGRNQEGIDLLEDLEEDIGQIRLKLGEDEKKIKILDKTNLSIGDMKKALKENSIKLYRIKKDIIIKNLDELGQ